MYFNFYLGQTECIPGNKNPEFITKFYVADFENTSDQMEFRLYDVKDKDVL
jgi:hypothetical protein